MKKNTVTTVTREQVDANMQDALVENRVEFGEHVTYVTVRMQNGYIIRESHAWLGSETEGKYSEALCFANIEEKVRLLLGFLLQNNLYLNQKAKEFGARFIDPEAIKEKYGEDVANAFQNILGPGFAESLPEDVVKVGEVVETDRGEKLECIGFNAKKEPIFKIVGE